MVTEVKQPDSKIREQELSDLVKSLGGWFHKEGNSTFIRIESNNPKYDEIPLEIRRAIYNDVLSILDKYNLELSENIFGPGLPICIYRRVITDQTPDKALENSYSLYIRATQRDGSIVISSVDNVLSIPHERKPPYESVAKEILGLESVRKVYERNDSSLGKAVYEWFGRKLRISKS